MNEVTIQIVTIDGILELQAIGRQTFAETFASDNSPENLAKYLEARFSIEQLTNELLDENTVFYFALVKNMVVGYLKLNFGHSQTEVQDERSVEIERIYVARDFHGKQVGQVLYQQALEVAKDRDASYIWLGVWEENPRAIRFYEKNGFVAFDKHIFVLGDDEQTDIMMKLIL